MPGGGGGCEERSKDYASMTLLSLTRDFLAIATNIGLEFRV